MRSKAGKKVPRVVARLQNGARSHQKGKESSHFRMGTMMECAWSEHEATRKSERARVARAIRATDASPARRCAGLSDLTRPECAWGRGGGKEGENANDEQGAYRV